MLYPTAFKLLTANVQMTSIGIYAPIIFSHNCKAYFKNNRKEVTHVILLWRQTLKPMYDSWSRSWKYKGLSLNGVSRNIETLCLTIFLQSLKEHNKT